MRRREVPAFTSALRPWQLAAVLLWLPVHLFALPWLLLRVTGGAIGDAQLNFLTYAIGAGYMLLVGWRFLRRDFDPLCDRPFRILLEILGCYGAMLLFNLAVTGLLTVLLEEAENPNNSAMLDMAVEEYGKMSAVAVFLAPILEEMIFRAGVFGGLRRYSRTFAYIASIALFSLYHVWGYAISDPSCWIYLLQYVPVSYLLCRCYERCDSIWGSIFFHMTVNFISLRALMLLEELM